MHFTIQSGSENNTSPKIGAQTLSSVGGCGMLLKTLDYDGAGRFR